MEKSKEMVPSQDKDFEGGFGGQEDLEDRYATTSGDHWMKSQAKSIEDHEDYEYDGRERPFVPNHLPLT